MKKDPPLTPAQIIFRGHLVATLPALLLLVAVFVIFAHWIAQPMLWPQPSLQAYFRRLGLVSVGALVVGWLWWSVAILRWRAWARTQAADEQEVQRLGQRTLLLWPKGSLAGKN
jgi:hypothetical protein